MRTLYLLYLGCYLHPLVDNRERFRWNHSSSCPHEIINICLCFCRSSRAVLQPDVVPQPGPRPHVHSSDRLGQRSLHSAVGQEEAVHPGSVYRNADRCRVVSEWISDWWVCGMVLLISIAILFLCASVNWYRCILLLHLWTDKWLLGTQNPKRR